MLKYLVADKKWMSLEMPQEISLEELVSHSTYILVVERLRPFEKVEMVELHEDKKKCPPFRKVTYRYRVLEELVNRGGLRLKKEIEIVAPFTSMDMEAHRKIYIEGVSKSTIRPEYNGGADFGSGKLIVFLQSNFEFVAGGAYESLVNKDKIMKVI
ncbi:MAG: hypothetical protein ABIH29_05820 [Candidatus Micrarchaeota archaeon]